METNKNNLKSYYNVLVTEDEKPISRNICNKIEKINPKFKVTKVAYNGKQAMEAIKSEHFDVLFLDINIPLGSGLDILRYIKDNDIDSYCVLLTGYQTFEYAQTALRNNAFDYLLKPLKTDKLTEVLCRIDTLMQRKNRDQILSYLTTVPHNIFEKGEKIIDDCFVGYVLYNTLQGKLYLPETIEHMSLIKKAFKKHLDEEFTANEYSLIEGQDIVEQILLFSSDVENLREKCKRIKKKMQEENMVIGVALFTEPKLPLEIRPTYQALRVELSNCISYKSCILITSPYHWCKPDVDKSQNWSLEKIVDIIKGISSNATSAQIKDLLNDCIDSCASHRKICIQTVKTFFQYLCSHLPTNVHYLNIEPEILEIMENSFNIEEAYKDLCSLIDDNFYFQVSSNENKEQLAKQIHDYIESNYQFAFSNQILSEKFGYVPYYLRRIFKEVYVMSPNEYIIQYRIEKSKCFLLQHMHAKDVAEIVGFKDPLYFSKVFKKIEGISPTEYVKQNDN